MASMGSVLCGAGIDVIPLPEFNQQDTAHGNGVSDSRESIDPVSSELLRAQAASLSISIIPEVISSFKRIDLGNGLSGDYDTATRKMTLSNGACIHDLDFIRSKTSEGLDFPDGNLAVYCEDSKKLLLFGEDLIISFSDSGVKICADYEGVDYVDFFHKPQLSSVGVSCLLVYFPDRKGDIIHVSENSFVFKELESKMDISAMDLNQHGIFYFRDTKEFFPFGKMKLVLSKTHEQFLLEFPQDLNSAIIPQVRFSEFEDWDIFEPSFFKISSSGVSISLSKGCLKTNYFEYNGEVFFDSDTKDCFPHGKGRLSRILPDGSRELQYSGEFYMGQKHGKGSLYDGMSCFRGFFYRDKEHGEGFLTHESAGVYRCVYNKGHLEKQVWMRAFPTKDFLDRLMHPSVTPNCRDEYDNRNRSGVGSPLKQVQNISDFSPR